MSSTSHAVSPPRGLGGSFRSRARQKQTLSISDPNHHITEAIGDMYGDDDDNWKRDSIQSINRPLSFMQSPTELSIRERNEDQYFASTQSWTHSQPTLQVPTSPPTSPATSRPQIHINGNKREKAMTEPNELPSQKSGYMDGTPPSPSHSLREDRHLNMDTTQTLPLGDIDYNSDPAAITKEFNNLQALRRMSMGNTSDPDLPSFNGISIMPSVAPTGDDDEDDPSRLFWVPARVHPELAPMEFKSFLENRVKTIKRRSGEGVNSLSPKDALERSNSGGSLRRKRSMLSRQIDNSGGRGALGYQDGAEKLERRKSTLSQSTTQSELKLTDLTQLDELVKDPKAMQKMSLDSGSYEDPAAEVPIEEDMPILPAAPGIGLRRSTHTTYRKGSLRRGERVPYSKRAAQAGLRQADADGGDSASDGALTPGSKRVFSEPVTENFSRPGRRHGATQGLVSDDPSTQSKQEEDPKSIEEPMRSMSLRQIPPSPPVPQIIETPPAEEQPSEGDISPPKSSPSFPERSSSYPVSAPSEPPPRSARRPQIKRQESSVIDTIPKTSTSIEMGSTPSKEPPPTQAEIEASERLAHQIHSQLPVNNASTNDLAFIPIAPAAERNEVKSRKEQKYGREKDQDDNESTISKKSWFSFKSSGSKKDKDKNKGGDDDESLSSKRGKVKTGLDKIHDSARLDVLQHSIESTTQRGRESLLLDRESIDNKLTTERSKESRKSSEKERKEDKKLFGGLFSSKKKDKASNHKKSNYSLGAVSLDVPKKLRPDVDYNWTRFSLLEERAIYRMAHIKLANPRRPLHSQVLLSNFMYAYLAKVQQMNPQMQIPKNPAQKKIEEKEKKEREAREKREEEERRRQQNQYDYHQGLTDYAEPSDSGAGNGQQHQQYQQDDQQSGSVTYVDDSQIFDYEQRNSQDNGQNSDRSHSRQSERPNENGYNNRHQQPNPHAQSRDQEQYYQYDDAYGE